MGIKTWDKKPLKQLCIRIGDGLHGTPKYVEDGEIYFINGNNLKNGKIEITTDTKKVSSEVLESNYIGLDSNTLLLSINGTLGSMAFYNDENIMLGKSAAYLNFKTGINQFYYYYFQLKNVQNCFYNLATGSTIKNLGLKSIQDFEVPVPNENEWKKIAKVLSDLDAKIELNNKINAELEAMAKLIYDYWFVQFEFPHEFKTITTDKNGRRTERVEVKPYKSSGGKMVWNEELKREIPAGWSEGCVSDLFDINPTLSIKKDTLGSYIDMNALPETGFMTKKIKKKVFKGGVKFQNGDVVVARITPCLENGKTGLITLLKDSEVGFGSTEFIVLRGKQMDLRSYGCCLSRSEEFRKHAISKMTGTSGRKRVKSEAIEDYKIPLPSINLLKEFEYKVSSLFEIMTVNVKQNQKLSEFRDWLLPMLMNGQVRVGEREEKMNMAAEPEIN